MDTILNLISMVGIWSSIALLAWGAALTLGQIFAPPTQTPEPPRRSKSNPCLSAIVMEIPRAHAAS
jgi:hypothetical protein